MNFFNCINFLNWKFKLHVSNDCVARGGLLCCLPQWWQRFGFYSCETTTDCWPTLQGQKKVFQWNALGMFQLGCLAFGAWECAPCLFPWVSGAPSESKGLSSQNTLKRKVRNVVFPVVDSLPTPLPPVKYKSVFLMRNNYYFHFRSRAVGVTKATSKFFFFLFFFFRSSKYSLRNANKP